jgi:hypothetical protein
LVDWAACCFIAMMKPVQIPALPQADCATGHSACRAGTAARGNVPTPGDSTIVQTTPSVRAVAAFLAENAPQAVQ